MSDKDDTAGNTHNNESIEKKSSTIIVKINLI